MFVFDSEEMVAANVHHIRAMFIDRLEDVHAYTDAEHDKADRFMLKAVLDSKVSVTLCEVVGMKNVPVLKKRMRQITEMA